MKKRYVLTDFGKKEIKKRMVVYDFSNNDFAVFLNRDANHISKMFTGKTVFTVKQVKDTMYYLGIEKSVAIMCFREAFTINQKKNSN